MILEMLIEGFIIKHLRSCVKACVLSLYCGKRRIVSKGVIDDMDIEEVKRRMAV